MSKSSRILSRDGFTLLEVMVTLLLAVTVISSLLWASLSSRHSVRMGTIYAQATALAKSYAERVKAMDYDAVADAADAGVTISDNGSAGVADDIVGNVTTDVTDNGDQTKTVTVTVDWTMKMLGNDRNHQVSLATMVSDL